MSRVAATRAAGGGEALALDHAGPGVRTGWRIIAFLIDRDDDDHLRPDGRRVGARTDVVAGLALITVPVVLSAAALLMPAARRAPA